MFLDILLYTFLVMNKKNKSKGEYKKMFKKILSSRFSKTSSESLRRIWLQGVYLSSEIGAKMHLKMDPL